MLFCSTGYPAINGRIKPLLLNRIGLSPNSKYIEPEFGCIGYSGRRCKMFCTKCGVEAQCKSKFCANCSNRSPATETSNAEQGISRRQITVLFCDLVGSTSLAESMDAEDLFYAMQAYHTMVKRITVRFNGHVAKVVGDGVDLYFGYPIAGEDDAVRAIHAALAIVEEVKHLTGSDGNPVDLQVRVGLATGRVTVGMLDTMSIVGSAPNLAARIQAEAQPGQVVVAPNTRRIAGAQFVYQDLGMFALKGFSDEVRISAVTSAHAFESRSAWRGRNSMFPMVGRDAELAKLQQCWQSDNTDGVLLRAEAGIAAQDHGVELQIQEAGSDLVQAEKLEAQLAIAGITQAQDLALMAALLDIKVENRYPPLAMPPPAKLQMTEEILLRYFSELASQIPVSPTEATWAKTCTGSTPVP